MELWRGLWAFELTGESTDTLVKVAEVLHADYLWQTNSRIVIISRLVLQTDVQYIRHWFAHIDRLLKNCGSSIGHSVCTTSVADYGAQLTQLYQKLGSNLKIHVLSDKRKLLMCDLGDVIWDECPAQMHMRDVARKVLQDAGREVTEQQWINEYLHIAEKSSGDRFYQCVGRFTDAVGVRTIREEINRDFLTMGDSDYIALHPLREDIWNCFFDLYRKYEICFVANQPSKAYRLLQEYNIGLISPIWFLSCRLGVKKPDSAIFRTSLERMCENGKHYSECFMLGNRKEMDLIPSSEIGAKGILFLCHNSPLCERELHRTYTPWRTVNSLIELRNLLLERQ